MTETPEYRLAKKFILGYWREIYPDAVELRTLRGYNAVDRELCQETDVSLDGLIAYIERVIQALDPPYVDEDE